MTLRLYFEPPTTSKKYNPAVAIDKLLPVKSTAEIFRAFGFTLKSTLWEMYKLSIADEPDVLYVKSLDGSKATLGCVTYVNYLAELHFRNNRKAAAAYVKEKALTLFWLNNRESQCKIK